MGLSKVQFTKDWTNPDDFPTVETSEAKVREDMQALHDEMKDFVNNTLTVETDAEVARLDGEIERIDNTKATKEELIDVVQGQVPDNSISEQKLSSESVSVRALTEGTKDYLMLSQKAKLQMGLPDDAKNWEAFEFLGAFAEHWWSATHGPGGIGYNERRDSITSPASGYILFAYGDQLQVSKYIRIGDTGVIDLVTPEDFDFTTFPGTSATERMQNGLTELVKKAPCYIQNADNIVFYLPAGSTADMGSSEFTQRTLFLYNLTVKAATENPVVYAQTVTVESYQIPPGETTYEHSTDRHAHQDYEIKDGVEYRYLGVPLWNAVTLTRFDPSDATRLKGGI